ncbi:MAG: sulfatase-like hydrolase/transferase [Verrucomicrobiota bacterium]|jgi:arylsulfatase A-like enzyme
MKSNCFNRFGRALIAVLLTGAGLPGFSPGANAELSFVFTNNPPLPLPRRPSIILIVADGLGYGDLSCYGQKKFQTPNLDRLAAEGIRFTSYYAGDAASSPSRAALMLGRDSEHLRQRADVDIPLAPDEITGAQLLKQSGYHTGVIGEWNLGDDATGGAPWEKGFDEFAGYFDPNDADNFYTDYLWRYAPQSILTTNNLKEDFIGKEIIYSNTGDKHGQYIPDLYTKAALNFVQNNQPDQFNRYRPFFLLLNYKIPGAGRRQVPTDAPYSGEPWPQPEKNQAAMIARLDGYIGQLLEQLQQLDLTNDTVIFFTSDTGPEKGGGVDPKFFQSAGPFRGGRGELYEGGLRVPMIVHWPGKIPAGQVSDFIWAAWDFLPTALDIGITKQPTNIDGISVLPTLLGQTQTNRHEFYYWVLHKRETAQAIRMGDWKFFLPEGERLYNLKTDPGETQNVADKNPDVIAQFDRLANKIHDLKSRQPILPTGH